MQYEVIQVQKGSKAKKLLAEYKERHNLTFTQAIEKLCEENQPQTK